MDAKDDAEADWFRQGMMANSGRRFASGHLENPVGTSQAGFPDGRFADSEKTVRFSDQESLDIPHIHRVVINAKCSYYYIVKQEAPASNGK